MLKVGMEVQLRKADLKRALKVLKELGAKKDGVVKVVDADNEERMIYLIMPMNIEE